MALRIRPALLVFGLLCPKLLSQQPRLASPSVELPASSELNRLHGSKVAEIRVQSQGVEHPEWLIPLLPQKANDPLDKNKVRQSVQVLYNTGRFSRIQVEAEQSANGLVLIFNALGNYFFGSIRLEAAPNPPSENQLRNASKLALGEQFSDEALAAGISGMARVLQDNGYYQAKIEPLYEYDAPNQQVKVLFRIERGPRARIGKIKITGAPGESLAEAVQTTKLEPGDHVSSSNVTRALQRLRKKYQKQNRLEAQVVLAQRDYHPESNTLDYTFDISRGPVVVIKVEGDSLASSTIKKYVPIYEENAVDEDLLNEGRSNLRDYLQTQGYFDAKVEYKEKSDPAGRRYEIVYNIEKGERHKVLDIEIVGNKYFSRDVIRDLMESQPAGGLQLTGTVSQSLAARDAQTIESLYRTNGFLKAKVTPKVKDDYQGKKAQLKLTMVIDEGPQFTVGKLTIVGNTSVTDQELRALIAASEGQPYSDTTVANDQTHVVAEYFNRGFPTVRMEYSVKPSPGDPTKIDVTYKITEGQRVYVDKVLISGLHYTKPFVVDREMKIHSNEPLNQNLMLESQRRLYDLGIFNAVEMAVQNPEGDAARKNINFQLEEARRYTFSYGVGFEVQTGQPAASTQPQGQPGASARVSFEATRLNFRGRDHTITLRTRYGNLQKRAVLSYDAPRLFDQEKLTLNFTALYDDTFDVRTFEAKRLEGSAEIRQALNRGTTLLYRFTYRRVSIPGGSLVIDPNLVPLFSQPVRVGMPSFTYVRDTRDDPTNSHKGAFSSFDAGVAAGFFGSQTSFGRVLLQNATYYQFHKRRWVFARSTRIGVESMFGSTTFIPLPERFLSGGSNSHRGFGLNQAGPRDLTTGFPVGGEALFVNSLELRTPPLPIPWAGNNISGVVFHDMGNVFATPSAAAHSFFRYAQRNRDACLNPALKTCDFNYTSHAIGSGIRYHTPIGPVGVDVGYNLNPPAFPIGSQNRSDVLHHFNFFFTIGQTF